MRDFYDDYGEPTNRAAAVRRILKAKLGLTDQDLDAGKMLPGFEPSGAAEPFGPPLPLWWTWRHEFAVTGEGQVISLELYRCLGGRFRETEPEVPAPRPVDDTTAGYEEMRHG